MLFGGVALVTAGLTDAIRMMVAERDGYACCRCSAGVMGQQASVHHRKPSGMGGSRRSAMETNRASNLLVLCGSGTTGCHGWVEANPTFAFAYGWRCPRWMQPTDWAVWIDGRWFLLLGDMRIPVDTPCPRQLELVEAAGPAPQPVGSTHP